MYFRVAVKPVSTIGRAQETATFQGKKVVLEAKGRHDPCVLPRTPPLVEGMVCTEPTPALWLAIVPEAARAASARPSRAPQAALVLIDAALIQRSRLGDSVSTACDARSNFEPGAPSAERKKARRE